MREFLRRLLGRTKLDRIENSIRELRHELPGQVEHRVAGLVDELVQLDHRLLVAIQKHQDQIAALNLRLELLDAGLAERDQLRHRILDEQARVRQLADQTGNLITELAGERRALHDARVRADAADDLRQRCEVAERDAGVLRRECEGLRAQAGRLEAACGAVETARAALAAELERVARQRDDLLRNGGAA